MIFTIFKALTSQWLLEFILCVHSAVNKMSSSFHLPTFTFLAFAFLEFKNKCQIHFSSLGVFSVQDWKHVNSTWYPHKEDRKVAGILRGID